MKKLLHIALGNHNKGLWSSFDKHFETTHYNWADKNLSYEELNKDILNVFNNFKPDIVFMQIQREGVISLDTCEKMTKLSYTINWTGDVRYPLPNWFVETGKNISLTLFSNMQDVIYARDKGVNADFLQVGFDKNMFNPYGQKGDVADIIFLGSNYLSNNCFPLSQLRYDLVSRLTNIYGSRFKAYGGNWEKISPQYYFADTEEESYLYRNCKIAINLSHFDYGRYSSDRMLRLMGSGAFCLSHNFKGIERDYVIKEHLDIWDNLDDLILKINFYLENEYIRDNIAKKGCMFVRQNCDWDKRIEELKQMIC